MKDALVHRLRTSAPAAAQAAVSLRRLLPARYGHIVALRESDESLREEIVELRKEIDEFRRDSLRIAELTDIVEQRLADPQPPAVTHPEGA